MILLTGADGFLGLQLIKYLNDKEIDVKALVRSTSLERQSYKHVTYCFGDLLDITSLESAMEGVSHIIHCAGFVSFQPKDKDLLFKINIEGTSNVVNVALHHKVKKIVFISSIEAFDIKLTDKIINESTKIDINQLSTTYGITKRLAEIEIWRGMAEGLMATIINPGGIIHGSHYSAHPMMMIPFAEKGMTYHMNGFAPLIDMQDLCEIIYKATFDDKYNGEQYIAIAENVAFENLLNILIQNLKVPYKPKILPPFMQVMGVVFEFLKSKVTRKNARLTKEYVHLAKRKTIFDNKKITSHFQLKFKPISLSLQEAIEAYKSK